MRIICSAGGTGGHIFPAVAVAQKVVHKRPDAEVLFIGAKGRMEMEKVPKAGFRIKGLWISGLQRSLTIKNLLFPVKLGVSIISAFRIILNFKPDVVAGFGGYASGAALWVASKMGIPTLIMEQNSFPGITNKLMNGNADVVCIAYQETERYFHKSKVVITGNPIRASLSQIIDRKIAIEALGFNPSKQTIIVIGGSQGAGSINKAISNSFEELRMANHVQLLWQCGKGYYDTYVESDTAKLENVFISAFVDDMAQAYASADLVICRAGALTIAEIMFLGKAAILVPSPNVAEDHQTKNALSLLNANACEMVRDSDLKDLIPRTLNLLGDERRLSEIGSNAKKLSRDDAVERIVEELEMLISE